MSAFGICDGRVARCVTALLSADAVTFGRRIYLSAAAAREIEARTAAGMALLRHERAHVAQFGSEGASRFLWNYAAAYLKGRRAGLSHAAAYREIPYEIEARAAEPSAPQG